MSRIATPMDDVSAAMSEIAEFAARLLGPDRQFVVVVMESQDQAWRSGVVGRIETDALETAGVAVLDEVKERAERGAADGCDCCTERLARVNGALAVLDAGSVEILPNARAGALH